MIITDQIETKRLIYIDSLRGVASVIVAIFWHYQHFSSAFQPNAVGSVPPFYNFAPARLLFDHGDVMVDLFFVLSGVIFSYTYRSSIGQLKVSAYTFFSKRFSRLYPVHLLTLFLAALLAYIFYAQTNRYPLFGHDDTYHFDGYHFVLNLFFLQKGFLDNGYSFNAPAWSLSIEAFMYLLFFVQSRSKYVLYSSVAFVLIGLVIFRMRYSFTFLINEPIARGLIGFFTGCLLYEVLIQKGLYKKYRWSIIALYGLSVLLYAVYLSNRITLPPNIIMVCFAVLLIAELHYNRTLQLALNNRFLITLGDISLSVYLIHVPIQFAILLYYATNKLPIVYDDSLLFFLYGIAVVVAGWVLHVTIEKPAQNWLRLRMKQKRINPA